MGARFRKGGGRSRPGPGKKEINPEEIQDFIRQVKGKAAEGYRERSLTIHGWICAKCGREFDRSELYLLTVHHKDGNHSHNPPDGSNWENLCIYCHEDEHSRGMLGDYLTEGS